MSGQNACADCWYYDECGRPERPIKCMGYEKQEERKEHEQKKDR